MAEGMNRELHGAVLSKEALLDRLDRQDLVVSPLLDRDKQVGNGSIDISIGTKFIISQRSQMTEIDPRQLTAEKIQEFQRATVRAFGDELTLHPHNFVLGATFEFIRMPLDLCGFVLSRSSYGRAGLLVATATYVHPGWQGCLTLELENLGEIPIKLRPLEDVAQLVVLYSTELRHASRMKSLPVGPEFTALSKDSRLRKLERLESLL